MRAPTAIFKTQNGYKFRIRYRQITYVERFFFVDIKHPDNSCIKTWQKEVIKIKAFHLLNYNLLPQQIFGFLLTPMLVNWNMSNKVYRQIDAFLHRVNEYDNYLDNT